MDFSIFDLYPGAGQEASRTKPSCVYPNSPAAVKTSGSPDSIRLKETDIKQSQSALLPPTSQHQRLSSPAPSLCSDISSSAENGTVSHSLSIPTLEGTPISHLPSISHQSMVGPVRSWPKKCQPSRQFAEANSYWEKRKIWKSFKPFLQANPDLQQKASENAKLRRKHSLLPKPSKPLIRLPHNAPEAREKQAEMRKSPHGRHLLALATGDSHLNLPSGLQSVEASPVNHPLRHSVFNSTFEQAAVQFKATAIQLRQTSGVPKIKQTLRDAVKKGGNKKSL